MSDENERSVASAGSLAWIPVTERVPPPTEIVLWVFGALGGGFTYLLGRLGSGGEQIYSNDGMRYWATVFTHWMPLPAPPTDAK